MYSIWTNVPCSEQCSISWSHFISGSCFKVDIDVINRKFFANCNAVLKNSVHQLDLLKLQLSESYCLPVLQHCLGVITFSKSQLRIKCLLEYDISQYIWLFTNGNQSGVALACHHTNSAFSVFQWKTSSQQMPLCPCLKTPM